MSLRPTRRTLLLALTAVLACARMGRADDGFTFVTPTPSVDATDDLQWVVPLITHNLVAGGLYLDSLFLDVDDHDKGETRAPRTTRVPLSFMLRMHPSLSENEESYMQYNGPATAEHATLTFTLMGHDQPGHHWTRTVSVASAPGAGFAAYPSAFVTVNGRRVETVYVTADSLPHPGLLLVHGHASHARRMLHGAIALARRGYHVMLVSMPGYGQSEGDADFMGPATVQAASAALDALKSKPGVDAHRLAVWGVSRGATVAALLGELRKDVRAVVAQSGSYDLWATARGTQLPGFPQTIVAEAGRDSAAWRARSPLLAAAEMHAAVLVLHGEQDANVPAGQAHAFDAALKSHGVTVEEKFFPTATHALPMAEVMRTAQAFLARTLAP